MVGRVPTICDGATIPSTRTRGKWPEYEVLWNESVAATTAIRAQTSTKELRGPKTKFMRTTPDVREVQQTLVRRGRA